MKEDRKRELIELVDRECKKKFILTTSRIWGLFGLGVTILAIIIVTNFFSVIFNEVVQQMIELPEDAQTEYIIRQSFILMAFAISGVGFFISLAKFFEVEKSTVKKEIVESYFKRLSKREDVERKEKPFLKVLIKMKCSQFDISLAEVYGESKSLFEDKALLKRLYEMT